MAYLNVLHDGVFQPMASEEYVDNAISGITPSTGGSAYFTVTGKPFDFNGKTALFFGDSICEGHTGHGRTQNNYVKNFSEHVGLTATNRGQGGACFSYTYNGIPSIVDKIKATTLDKDFVFIEGGINDWQTGGTTTQLETALEDLGQYLTANCTVPVIIITPINHGGWTGGRPRNMTVQQVRTIMSKMALKYGFDLVLGENFNFPSDTNDPLVSILYGDKLHPSEAGYRLYAKGLETALC